MTTVEFCPRAKQKLTKPFRSPWLFFKRLAGRLSSQKLIRLEHPVHCRNIWGFRSTHKHDGQAHSREKAATVFKSERRYWISKSLCAIKTFGSSRRQSNILRTCAWANYPSSALASLLPSSRASRSQRVKRKCQGFNRSGK